MIVDIREVGAEAIGEYARVPIAFEVRQVFECIDDASARRGMTLVPRRLEHSYVKDCDAIATEHPTQWPNRFTGSSWALLFAYADGVHVGGAAVVRQRPDGEYSNRVSLWDIRVAEPFRRTGVGTALFRRAEAWALERGCRVLEVETQNINIPACRFYQRRGCFLHAANRCAYAEFPDEIQLIWRKSL